MKIEQQISDKYRKVYESGSKLNEHFEKYFQQALHVYLEELKTFAESLPKEDKVSFMTESVKSLKTYMNVSE